MFKKIKSLVPVTIKSNIKNFLKHLKSRSIKEINFKESFFRHNDQYLELEAFNREAKIHEENNEHTNKKEGHLNNIYEFSNSVGYFLDKDIKISNLIDIGSGTGWFVNYVSRNYPNIKSIFAIEPSSAAIEISKKIYDQDDKIKHINGFADKELKRLNKDVYLVTTFAVFQHLNLLYSKKIIKNINKIMEKNSILILKEPIAQSRYERFNLHYPRTEKFWTKNLKQYDVKFYNNKLIVAKKII